MKTQSFILCMILSMYAPLFGQAAAYKYKYAFISNDSLNTVIDTSSIMNFSDNKISLLFKIRDSEINFTLKNKTNEVVKIIWDEASIIQNGKSSKVMHSGVKYNDRNSSQTATVVPPQASIDDIVLPSNSVYWRDGLFGTSGSWEVEDFFPTLVLNNEIDSATIMKLKNQTISLFLPVQYQDKSLYYTFRFMVTEVTDITATSIKPVNKVVPNNPKNKNKKK